MKKKIVALVFGLLLVTAFMVFMLIYTRWRVSEILSQVDENTYETHYIMISDDSSNQWKSIYDAAKEAAAESGAYLDWIGSELPVQYDISDYLKIATANKVDGIILHLRAGQKVTELINAAAAQGIPVVTLFEDDPDSERISYIGTNSYQMGEIYGKQILKYLKPGKNDVAVLLNSMSKDSVSSLLYSQMVQVVDQGCSEDQNVSFTAYEINTATGFDAEEDIRDIFLESEKLPDIMICLDLISTECVSQALVDYNEVGNVTVLGYFASDKVKESIRKGLVEATLLLDTEEIGNLAIEALDEYRQLGRVSSYYNIGMQMITIKTLLRQDYSSE